MISFCRLCLTNNEKIIHMKTTIFKITGPKWAKNYLLTDGKKDLYKQ